MQTRSCGRVALVGLLGCSRVPIFQCHVCVQEIHVMAEDEVNFMTHVS